MLEIADLSLSTAEVSPEILLFATSTGGVDKHAAVIAYDFCGGEACGLQEKGAGGQDRTVWCKLDDANAFIYRGEELYGLRG